MFWIENHEGVTSCILHFIFVLFFNHKTVLYFERFLRTFDHSLKYLIYLTLSSISSMLSSLSAVTWEDFLKLRFNNVSDDKATAVTKVLG